MRAQPAAKDEPLSLLTERDVLRVAQAVKAILPAHITQAKPPPDPDQMIKWPEVCEERDRILCKTRKSVRQTLWKDVKLGILTKPVLLGARSARWRRGDVVAAYKAYAKQT